MSGNRQKQIFSSAEVPRLRKRHTSWHLAGWGRHKHFASSFRLLISFHFHKVYSKWIFQRMCHKLGDKFRDFVIYKCVVIMLLFRLSQLCTLFFLRRTCLLSVITLQIPSTVYLQIRFGPTEVLSKWNSGDQKHCHLHYICLYVGLCVFEVGFFVFL